MKRRKCGKRRYRDSIGAKFAMSQARAKDSSGRPVLEQRVYYCPRCHGWHLTSQPLRENA